MIINPDWTEPDFEKPRYPLLTTFNNIYMLTIYEMVSLAMVINLTSHLHFGE